jgi:hypothetical protein
MLSKEEILKPRYKVIADYPSQAFEMGNIIIGTSAYLVKGEGFCNSGYMQEYPHLFKKLEWWEERKIEDLPEYVKVVNSGCSICGVFKPIAYGNYPDEGYNYGNENEPYALILVLDNTGTHDEEEISMHLDNCVPSTREEYEQYQQPK